MTFAPKALRFDFSLANGNFSGGGNSHSATGLRSSAIIQMAGGGAPSAAAVAVYGLPLTVMNQLSTFGQVLTLVGRNTVTISAGDEGGILSRVFTGTISDCFMDGNSMPQVALRGEAYAGLAERVMPAQPTSQPGSQDVATLLGTMAQKAGLKFEGNGVSARIQRPYYPGSPGQQIAALCHDAKLEHIIDRGTLAVWPTSGSRSGVAEVSKDTGLVGYPTFNSLGVIFRALWQPGFQYGGGVKITSEVQPACGQWVIHKLEFELESKTDNGRWFAIVEAHRPGQQPVA